MSRPAASDRGSLVNRRGYWARFPPQSMTLPMSKHEPIAQRSLEDAAKQAPIPGWAIVILALSALVTVAWVLWILSLLF
jgi:hypothetical protein